MKQKIAILVLVALGAALAQRQMPAADPSGAITLEKAQQQYGALPKTGLIADPTGTAVIRAARSMQAP